MTDPAGILADPRSQADDRVRTDVLKRWPSMTLKFPNASYVEHLNPRRASIEAFDDLDLSSVRWWWEDCLHMSGGALPSSAQVERLLLEPQLGDRLLLIEDVDGDPRCAFAGGAIETLTGQTVTGVRLSHFGTPEADRRMLRAVYASVERTGRPVGLCGDYRINTAPAGRVRVGNFPVKSRLGGRVSILSVLAPPPYGASPSRPNAR